MSFQLVTRVVATYIIFTFIGYLWDIPREVQVSSREQVHAHLCPVFFSCYQNLSFGQWQWFFITPFRATTLWRLQWLLSPAIPFWKSYWHSHSGWDLPGLLDWWGLVLWEPVLPALSPFHSLSSIVKSLWTPEDPIAKQNGDGSCSLKNSQSGEVDKGEMRPSRKQELWIMAAKPSAAGQNSVRQVVSTHFTSNES